MTTRRRTTCSCRWARTCNNQQLAGFKSRSAVAGRVLCNEEEENDEEDEDDGEEEEADGDVWNRDDTLDGKPINSLFT